MYLQKVISIKMLFVGILGKSMSKIAGSGYASGSISQRHGSADPDPYPDPPENVMDPQHRFLDTVTICCLSRNRNDPLAWCLHIQINSTILKGPSIGASCEAP